MIHIIGVGEVEQHRTHPVLCLVSRRSAQFRLTAVLLQLFRCSVPFHHLFPHMDVLGNLVLGPTRALKRPSKEVETEAMAALARVGLADRAHALPRQLSGGQKQRVALVRAMLMHPEVLLLDEITAALDPEMVREVLDVVLELARSGMTMVIVTHEMRFAEAVADRVVFLENGLVVEESVPAQFFHQPHTQRAQQFLASFCYDSVRDGKNMQNTKEAN